MQICCPDGLRKKSGIKKKKKKSLLREPASHFPVMRHFCSQRGERCRSSYKKKSEAPGCLDSPNRPSAQVSVLRPAWSGMMNRVSPPSAPLLTLGHHVKACTNQAPAPPPIPLSLLLLLLSTCNKQIHNASLKTDANTLTHASIPTRHKQNQADLCLSAEQLHSHARTPAIHAMMPLP